VEEEESTTLDTMKEKQPKKEKPTKPKKAKALVLSRMRCSDLVEWLENVDPAIKQPEKNQRLIQRYSLPRNMSLLKLCGPLNAQHHFAHCMTARHLKAVPTIEMRVAGGKPDEATMPPFTASLKKIGAINNLVIHRWGAGAFMLAHPLKQNQP
jgi:hypothetical protein